jgi:hypothetical protein
MGSTLLGVVAHLVMRVYAVLFLTAVGGFLCANLSGVVGSLYFVTENKTELVLPWVHGGWYLGTTLAFVGAITGQLRLINGVAALGHTREAATVPAETKPPAIRRPPAPRNSLLVNVFGLGLVGGLAGAILGCSLLIFWFSLATSPFAPPEWTASVVVSTQPFTGAAPPRKVHRTSPPLPRWLLFVPAALGATAGAMVGVWGTCYQAHQDRILPGSLDQ